MPKDPKVPEEECVKGGQAQTTGTSHVTPRPPAPHELAELSGDLRFYAMIGLGEVLKKSAMDALSGVAGAQHVADQAHKVLISADLGVMNPNRGRVRRGKGELKVKPKWVTNVPWEADVPVWDSYAARTTSDDPLKEEGCQELRFVSGEQTVEVVVFGCDCVSQKRTAEEVIKHHVDLARRRYLALDGCRVWNMPPLCLLQSLGLSTRAHVDALYPASGSDSSILSGKSELRERAKNTLMACYCLTSYKRHSAFEIAQDARTRRMGLTPAYDPSPVSLSTPMSQSAASAGSAGTNVSQADLMAALAKFMKQ
eukprot:TRINITY_DN750_c0_g1_i2.p1 TRINITY_DN750_c0_g1~~TRINITY_DN750_c0_g1_i2.p1  ORF type:complete len:311 (+),score=11.80 TRINITY_DN750_c0_g1_i2:53-985(+)